MNIILYSNCRLTKSYNEVIHKSYLDSYLNKLIKYEYNNIDYVYLSNSGRINLDIINNSMYVCNYMKVEDTDNNITRYFFIDEIEIINGIAVVDYTEDVFASYSDKIKIVKGEISNLRYGIENNPKILPNEYISNDKLKLKPILTTEGLNKQFYILITLQLYKLGTSGEITDREFLSFVCGSPSSSQPTAYYFSSAEYLIENIIKAHSIPDSVERYYSVNDSRNTYKSCDIENIVLIPKEYYNLFSFSYITTITTSISNGETKFVYLRNIASNIYSFSYSIENNYKRYAIGTIDNYCVIDNNGSDIDFELDLVIDECNIELLMKVGTNIVNITKSFSYVFPIDLQSADVTQQQRIALALNNYSLDIEKRDTITKGAMGILGGIGKTATGTALGLAGDITGLGMASSGIASIGNSMVNIVSGLERNNLQKWYINYNAYKTSTAIKTHSILMLNCYYGIASMEVTPDNENYIDNLIETIGYNTLLIVNDNSLLNEPKENQVYNIIKFSNLWLYGNIPHNIQLLFEEIYKKGFKIWFTSDVY